MGAVERKLKEMGIRYVQSMVEDGGIYVEQLFFHDPDGFMIEICNCDNLPVVPLVGSIAACPRVNMVKQQHNKTKQQQQQQQQVAALVQRLSVASTNDMACA